MITLKIKRKSDRYRVVTKERIDDSFLSSIQASFPTSFLFFFQENPVSCKRQIRHEDFHIFIFSLLFFSSRSKESAGRPTSKRIQFSKTTSGLLFCLHWNSVNPREFLMRSTKGRLR